PDARVRAVDRRLFRVGRLQLSRRRRAVSPRRLDDRRARGRPARGVGHRRERRVLASANHHGARRLGDCRRLPRGRAIRAGGIPRSRRRLSRGARACRRGDAGVGARVVGRGADRVRAAGRPRGVPAAARGALAARPGLRVSRLDRARRVSHSVSRTCRAPGRRVRSFARGLVTPGTSRMMNYNGYFSRAAAGMQESAIRKMGALGSRIPDLISFAPGYPAAEMFAWDAFRDVAQAVLDGADATVLQYGPTRGYRPLVEALPEILG